MALTPESGAASRPLRADARRNRERVLAAAREVFAEYGDAAQMDDIARRAEVGVGTLYRHFPTKETLVGELIRIKLLELAERARRFQRVDGPWEAFAGYVRETAGVMAADASQRNMMWSASPEAMAAAAAAKAELMEDVGVLIRRGREAGVLRADFAAPDMSALMCALAGAMGGPSRSSASGDWRKVLEFLLDGLRPPAG
jgi:AcrR family transcriptional regulator